MVQAIGTPTAMVCQMVPNIVSHSRMYTPETNERIAQPSNASDGYSDWDEDGLNDLEEYQVALKFGLLNGLPSLPLHGLKIPMEMEYRMVGKHHNTTATLQYRSILVTPMQMMTSISMVGILMETETSSSMSSN